MEQFWNLFGPLKPVGRSGTLPAQGQESVSGRNGLKGVSDGKSLSSSSRDRVDVGKLPYLIAINQKIADRFQSLSRTFGFSAPEAKSSPEKAKSAAEIAREDGTSSKKAEVKTGKEVPSLRSEIKMSKAEAPPAEKSASPAKKEPPVLSKAGSDSLPARRPDIKMDKAEASPAKRSPPVLSGESSSRAESSPQKPLSMTSSAFSSGAALPTTPKMSSPPLTGSRTTASSPPPGKPAADGGSVANASLSSTPVQASPAKSGFPMNFQPEVSQVLLASLNKINMEKESLATRDGKDTNASSKGESGQDLFQPLNRNQVQSPLRANVLGTRPTPPASPGGGMSLNRSVTRAASAPPPAVGEKNLKTGDAEISPPKIQARPALPEPPKPLRDEAPKPQETAKSEPPPKQEPQSLSARETLEAQLLLKPQANQQARVISSSSMEEKTDKPLKKEAPDKAEEAGSASPSLNRRDISRYLSPAAGSEVQAFQAESTQPSSSVVEDARQAEEQAFVSTVIQHHEEARAKPDLHLPMMAQLAAEYVPKDAKKSRERDAELNWAAVGEESDGAPSAEAEGAQSNFGVLNIADVETHDIEGLTQASFQAQKAPVAEAGSIGAVLLAAHESSRTPPFSSFQEAPPPPIVQTAFVKKSMVSSDSSYEKEGRSGEAAARAHVLQAGQKEPVRTGTRDFRYVSFSVGEMDTLAEKITSKSNARTLDFSQSRSLIVEVSRTSETPADEKGGHSGFGQGSGRDRYYTFQSEYILNQLKKQQLGESPHQNILETAKEATIQKCMKDAAQLEYFSRQAPLKHSQQASRLATTCIEVILRKSYKDDVTGERSAAKMLALMLKANNDDAFEHSTRVSDLSVSLAAEIGVTDEKDLRLIEEGALLHDIGETQVAPSRYSSEEQDRLALFLEDVDLTQCSAFHDIGKLEIPKEILNKTTVLTEEEYGIIKQHPIIGEEILRPIPSLRPILPTVRGHHERWDGEGYPDGLSGENIPLAARIISITDTWDAMISDRSYRKGIPLNMAARELRKGAGSQFDPELVDRFLALVEKQVAS
ncbi:MAG: HD domain-containing phosphohydrolase [bacterium]